MSDVLFSMMQQFSENLYHFQDTCNVYVVRNGDEVVLIDFGDGGILDQLGSLGILRVTDVLMTHHHRDQGQGLARAIACGARVWVPQVEQELFRDVDAHWQAREVYNNYNVREDRFSLLEPIRVAGTLDDYSAHHFAGHEFMVVPTPGHTVGSISLFASIDGRLAAFTGDLIAGPGKVWSLAATHWTYNGAEGVAASIASLVDLKARQPDLLLPSHGDPMDEPALAIDLLITRLWDLLQYRKQSTRLMNWIDKPYAQVTPHLLVNRTSVANSYVLLSASGRALLIDFGYDMMTGFAAGVDRASRRPWLYTLPALRRDYGVTKIDAAIATHYHDDHVAGLNLLRQVEGTQVWAAENFSRILEHPADYDLPCLWYDPIHIDRVLPFGQPVCWQEYEFRIYPLPGHTLYASAIAFEVDGRRVLATGDQYQGDEGEKWNYVYKGKYRFGDYARTAELYRRLNPDLIISGHWNPLHVQPGYFDMLEERGQILMGLHRDLLPLETFHFDGEGFGAWIRPYQVEACAGERIEFDVEVRNPFAHPADAELYLVTPAGWHVAESSISFPLGPHATETAHFHVAIPPGGPTRRERIAADLTVGNHRLGQQAEALVTVL